MQANLRLPLHVQKLKVFQLPGLTPQPRGSAPGTRWNSTTTDDNWPKQIRTGQHRTAIRFNFFTLWSVAVISHTRPLVRITLTAYVAVRPYNHCLWKMWFSNKLFRLHIPNAANYYHCAVHIIFTHPRKSVRKSAGTYFTSPALSLMSANNINHTSFCFSRCLSKIRV